VADDRTERKKVIKNYYTTGEIAKITGISQRTIKYYCTNGKIDSESTPLTNYRRISHKSLVRFFKDNDLPLELLEKYSRKKILIVDDDVQIIRLLSETVANLSTNTYVETASDGYEACIKAGGLIPDIIFLDLQMPKADGFEVCKTIRNAKSTSRAEIVIISGFITPESLKRLEEFDIRRIFQKPLDIAEFSWFIKGCLLNGCETEQAGRIPAVSDSGVNQKGMN
jgi:two-component system, OmpR family, alkaline phosphatase synthesis response regulator PhoP